MLKQFILLVLIALAFSQEICPESARNACYSNAEVAVKQCEKAAKAKGSDEGADVNCVKFMLISNKECWPCICEIAKMEGWKVKGCSHSLKIMEAIQNLRAQ